MDDDFGTIGELIRMHAQRAPERLALVDGSDSSQAIDYRELDHRMDDVAAALHESGLALGDRIAICGRSSVPYALVFLGALRAGVVVVPLAPSSTPQQLARMLSDSGARLFFVDDSVADLVSEIPQGRAQRIALDESKIGASFSRWTSSISVPARPATIEADSGFNIIYSSGTTGEPKGIVQSHGMRWTHMQRGRSSGYTGESVSVLATPLYSNTTLVVFFPTLAFGGTVVLLNKFSVPVYLSLCQSFRATHTMLVPVQYRRLMASDLFDAHDLSAFVIKFSTSAPFSAALKADVLRRWPGGLIEYYGMTEGGGTCILEAHLHPDKLHTVGQPASGSDIRLIDENGRECAPGETGEVVGSSGGMMTGYFGQSEKTRSVEWFDASGKRFIRTGDVGRFDSDGFLVLMDRKKDMIISGGFNIYPSDLEEVLCSHPAVLEAAVVALPSEEWGESPGAFVVWRKGHEELSTEDLRAWVNARVGKTQRIVSVNRMDELPRSAIGKVLKRELRESSATSRGSSASVA
ncbi:class I adenylate-forming enzyme family protein [Variovorax saccharolyticus]|uniref:class I adenylate-forming enzyme family protein n=1 Tax=Variovorax saccharolyticus TaxID=3053516 RepID=UPI0025763A34|nr:class I adenylate-forming enzyme family protein [Variovorax sp. J22R187]MDM0021896.1 class I adenylate-forming enzyme family protein [Variovorax sp. J22R187]